MGDDLTVAFDVQFRPYESIRELARINLKWTHVLRQWRCHLGISAGWLKHHFQHTVTRLVRGAVDEDHEVR